MVQSLIIAHNGSFRGRLAIMTIREHLCGYFEQKVTCTDAGSRLDPASGHAVCLGCGRITVTSGLRRCDICDKEFINKKLYQNPRYDTICPPCIKEHELEEV